MRFPFENKYAPFTDACGFIECNIELALEKYLEWIIPQINSIKQSGQNELNQQEPVIKKFNGTFIELINEAEPFYYPEKTILFEAKNNWIGYFENIRGTEISRIRRIAERISPDKISIGVQAWQNNYNKKANDWCGGSFTLNVGAKPVRHIMLSDQDKWEFDQSGNPLPFEDLEKYLEKFAKNRFTPEMLQTYLLEYNIDYFNDDFYMPTGSKAYIIEQIRDPYPNETQKTLKERRIELKY